VTTFRIEVTAEDIADGDPHDSEHCPVALALRRGTGARWLVDADRLLDAETDLEWTPPNRVTKFVEAFDSGMKVKPFSFEVDYGDAARVPYA
jgi:hypothetical protein